MTCCKDTCKAEDCNVNCDCNVSCGNDVFRPLHDFVVLELVAEKKSILLIQQQKQIDPNSVKFKVISTGPDCKFVRCCDIVVPNAGASVGLPNYTKEERELYILKENQIYAVVNTKTIDTKTIDTKTIDTKTIDTK